MKYEIFPISVAGSLEGRKLRAYILDNTDEIDSCLRRPLILICPGGGYGMVSEREAECIAVRYLGMGYHAAVLTYSVAPARYPTALYEVGYAMKQIHEHADEWHIDTDNIFIQGFSAGGHLAASLGVFWNRKDLGSELGVNATVLKPKGLILSYPVITAEEPFIHQGSFQNLLGEEYDSMAKELSLEKHVTKDTPPCFIWHTASDQAVPAQNSLLFAKALIDQGISVELHLYPHGVHGLSLANRISAGNNKKYLQPECENWIELVQVWLSNCSNAWRTML